MQSQAPNARHGALAPGSAGLCNRDILCFCLGIPARRTASLMRAVSCTGQMTYVPSGRKPQLVTSRWRCRYPLAPEPLLCIGDDSCQPAVRLFVSGRRKRLYRGSTPTIHGWTREPHVCAAPRYDRLHGCVVRRFDRRVHGRSPRADFVAGDVPVPTRSPPGHATGWRASRASAPKPAPPAVRRFSAACTTTYTRPSSIEFPVSTAVTRRLRPHTWSSDP